MSKTPNPGSDEALDQGCICATLDNGRGDEELGRIRGSYITEGCPLHDVAPPQNQEGDK